MANAINFISDKKAIKAAIRELNRDIRKHQKELLHLIFKRDALAAILKGKPQRKEEGLREGVHDDIFQILRRHPKGMTTAEITAEIVKQGKIKNKTPSGTVYLSLIRHPTLFARGVDKKWFCKK